MADSCFGLLVRDVGDLATAPGAPPLPAGQSLSGLLLPTLGEIWVNEWEGSKWPGRRRFTIGHELGHWVMHSPGTKSIFCRSQSVQPEEEAPSIPPMEEEAQVFASRLLMPEHLVRKFAPDFRDDLDGLCALFGTSRVAMTRRLEDLQAS